MAEKESSFLCCEKKQVFENGGKLPMTLVVEDLAIRQHNRIDYIGDFSSMSLSSLRVFDFNLCFTDLSIFNSFICWLFHFSIQYVILFLSISFSFSLYKDIPIFKFFFTRYIYLFIC